VHKVWAAIDGGTIVQPEMARRNIESGIVYGLSSVLKERATIKDGVVEQSNFHDYEVLRMSEAPEEIHVEFADRDTKPTGLGEIGNPFMAKGLQMAIDGQEPGEIEDILFMEMEKLSARHAKGSDIMSQVGTMAPAMGMIGTLVGLVLMLQNMSDPSSIGPAMAVALLTTFYGAILANMVFNPVAGKLRTRSREELLYKEFILVGVVSIAGGENPRILEQRLHSLMAPPARVSAFPQPKARVAETGVKAW